MERIKLENLENLPAEYDEGYRPSPRELASNPSLSNLLPQRERPADPLLEERRQDIQDRMQDRRERREILREGLDIRRQNQGDAGGTVTTTERERAMTPENQALAEASIAATAIQRGVNRLPAQQQAAALQKIAADFGMELSGNASVQSPDFLPRFMGGNRTARLSGDFSLRPKALTTTTERNRGGNGGQRGNQKPQSGAMSQMPNPAEHRGKTIRDTETGQRYQSDGRQWVPVN